MIDIVTPQSLLRSLQCALPGEVHPQLRQASIQADGGGQVVRIRFEYDGHPADEVRDRFSRVAAQVLAEFAGAWTLDEQHVSIPSPLGMSPLPHVAYRRAERR